jgi:ornithine carbamoyltransferase
MSMIFQKLSTRTRVSSESGFSQLGGHALFLSSNDIQLGKNESLKDTAHVLSRFNDVLLARVYSHQDIIDLCKYSSKPVINALSDTYHPLQLLADIQTLEEHYAKNKDSTGVRGKKITWIGDGNNICNTFLSAAGALGYHFHAAVPKGYEPPRDILEKATNLAASSGVSVQVTNSIPSAVNGADVIVTDTWVSMGQEEEAKKRKADFRGYQVTEKLALEGKANPNWVFLHCLPRKPEEVDDEVFYNASRSLVWDEAENRKWTVMAVALAQIVGEVRIP